MRLLLALCLLLSSVAFPKDKECARSCDDLLKPMAADCRKSEKGGGHGGGDKHEDSHNDAEACQAAMKKMRTACLKDCSGEPRKKR